MGSFFGNRRHLRLAALARTLLAAAVGAELHCVPVARPLFAPGEGQAAAGAELAGQVLFFAHAHVSGPVGGGARRVLCLLARPVTRLRHSLNDEGLRWRRISRITPASFSPYWSAMASNAISSAQAISITCETSAADRAGASAAGAWAARTFVCTSAFG